MRTITTPQLRAIIAGLPDETKNLMIENVYVSLYGDLNSARQVKLGNDYKFGRAKSEDDRDVLGDVISDVTAFLPEPSDGAEGWL